MVAPLEARDLLLRYPNGIRALDRVGLRLEEGELLAVLGPNGAGKSSLCRALLGLHRLQGGSVLVQGRPLPRLSIRERARRICLVMQDLPLPANRKVRDFVASARYPWLSVFSPLRTRDHSCIEAALEAVGALEQGERLLGELSGGERRRVLLARALAQETPVLLLDEPAGPLDPENRLRMLRRVRELATGGGRSVLLVTHDLNLASQFADRILLLSGGRVAAQGSPVEVLRPSVLGPVYGENFLYGRAAVAGMGEERPWILPWLEE